MKRRVSWQRRGVRFGSGFWCGCEVKWCLCGRLWVCAAEDLWVFAQIFGVCSCVVDWKCLTLWLRCEVWC